MKQPTMAIEKSKSSVHLSWGGEHTLPLKITGVDSLNLKDKVRIVIEGSVTGLRKDKYGSSLEVDMNSVHVTTNNKDLEDTISDD